MSPVGQAGLCGSLPRSEDAQVLCALRKAPHPKFPARGSLIRACRVLPLRATQNTAVRKSLHLSGSRGGRKPRYPRTQFRAVQRHTGVERRRAGSAAGCGWQPTAWAGRVVAPRAPHTSRGGSGAVPVFKLSARGMN